MTIAEAFYTIFEAYSTPRGERTGREFGIARSGVCNAINRLESAGRISWETLELMRVAVQESMPIPPYRYSPCGSPWFCERHDPANDLLRAMWCYLQYLIAGGE